MSWRSLLWNLVLSFHHVCAIAQTQVGRLGGKHLHPACHLARAPLFSFPIAHATQPSYWWEGDELRIQSQSEGKAVQKTPVTLRNEIASALLSLILLEPHIITTKSLGTFISSFFFHLCLHPPVAPFCSSFFATFRHFRWPSQKWRSLVVTFMSQGVQRAAKVIPPGNWVHLLD